MAKKNELATIDKFEIISRYEGLSEQDIADLEDELSDLDQERNIICKKIMIPNGTSNAFSIENEEDPDDSDPVKTFEAVIVFTHKANAYWESSFAGGDAASAPTCSAIDAKTGTVFETGEVRECDRCQYNQFAADGSGKACKNMRRMYLLLSGRPSIYLLTLPPTSMKDVNRQLMNLVTVHKTPYSRMVMRFSLKKAESRSGITYNKVVVEKAGILPREMWEKVAAMHKEIKGQYQSFSIVDDETAPAAEMPVSDENGFVYTEGSADELPFFGEE